MKIGREGCWLIHFSLLRHSISRAALIRRQRNHAIAKKDHLEAGGPDLKVGREQCCLIHLYLLHHSIHRVEIYGDRDDTLAEREYLEAGESDNGLQE